MYIDKELLAYSLSFVFLFAILYVVLSQKFIQFTDEKALAIKNMFATAKYLQNSAMRLLILEKQKNTELEILLDSIKEKAIEDVQRIEKQVNLSTEERREHFANEFSLRIQRLNNQFTTGIKQDLIRTVFTSIEERLGNTKKFDTSLNLDALRNISNS